MNLLKKKNKTDLASRHLLTGNLEPKDAIYRRKYGRSFVDLSLIAIIAGAIYIPVKVLQSVKLQNARPGASAATATYYASPTGSPTASSCPSSSPCSLPRAITLGETTGGEVIAKDGVYDFVIPVPSSYGQWEMVLIDELSGSAQLTIRSENKWGAKLQANTTSTGTTSNTNANAMFRVAGNSSTYFGRSNVTIQDFSIEGKLLNGAVDVYGASNVKIIGNKMFNIGSGLTGGDASETSKNTGGKRCTKGAAIGTKFKNPGLVIDSNVIYNVGPLQSEPNGPVYTSCPLTHGIYDEGWYLTATNNVFSNIAGGCYQAYSGNQVWDFKPSDGTFTNNVCDRAGAGIIIGDDVTGTKSGGINFIVKNNSFSKVGDCYAMYKAWYVVDYANNNCYDYTRKYFSIYGYPELNYAQTPTTADQLNTLETKYHPGTYLNPGYVNYPNVGSPYPAGANYAIASSSAIYNKNIGLLTTTPTTTPTPTPTTTSTPTPTVTPTPVTTNVAVSAPGAGCYRFEAEKDMTLYNSVNVPVASSVSGYSGTGYRNWPTVSGALDFEKQANVGGAYMASVRYNASSASTRRLYHDYPAQAAVWYDLPATATNIWNVVTLPITLNSSTTHMSFSYDSANTGTVNIDYLDLCPINAATPTPTTTVVASATPTPTSLPSPTPTTLPGGDKPVSVVDPVTNPATPPVTIGGDLLIALPTPDKPIEVTKPDGTKQTLASAPSKDQIAKIEYYVNGSKLPSNPETPYQVDTSLLSNGVHTVTQKITYKDGSTLEQKANVDVQNKQTILSPAIRYIRLHKQSFAVTSGLLGSASLLGAVIVLDKKKTIFGMFTKFHF